MRVEWRCLCSLDDGWSVVFGCMLPGDVHHHHHGKKEEHIKITVVFEFLADNSAAIIEIASGIHKSICAEIVHFWR